MSRCRPRPLPAFPFSFSSPARPPSLALARPPQPAPAARPRCSPAPASPARGVPDLPLPGHGAPAPDPPLRVRSLARRRSAMALPVTARGLVPAPGALAGTAQRATPSQRAPLPWRARPAPSRLTRPCLRIHGGASPLLARHGAFPVRRVRDAARSAPARPRYLLAARSAARAQLGPGVRAARSRRVSAALRARVLAWCAWWFGTARRALGATRSILSRVACSSTPRRARLPLATCLPPCILCIMITLFILMKWKLNSEINYVSYFM
jgi:hypothetical protein